MLVLSVSLISGTGSSDISALTGFTGAVLEFAHNQVITTTLTSYTKTTQLLLGQALHSWLYSLTGPLLEQLAQMIALV